MAAEVVNLPESVLGCLDRLGPITASSEVRLESTIEPGAPGPRVFAVPKLLRAVVDNLVQTALRHTTRRECVRVSVLADGTCGIVEVRDGGAPVPPAIAEALFTRAGQRLATKEASSRYGRGLGLLVAGLAAGASGGSVEVVERDGKNAFRAAFKVAP
jgi:signal transduction histidine kinase